MKNIVLGCMLVAAIFSVPKARAQVSVGAKGGLNVSNIIGSGSQEFESKALMGFHAGGYVTFNFGRRVALQPELVYSTQGATLEGLAEEDMKLNYFNIPLMLKVMTNKGLYLEVGPQLGFNLGDLQLDDIEGSVNGSDLSACVGIGFQPTKSPLGIGVRYNVGLGEAGEFNDDTLDQATYKNGVFQLSIYLRLFGGGKLKR